MTVNFKNPVFISSDTARAVFRWEDAIAALQKAYAHSIPAKATPPRTVAVLEKTWLRNLPAIPPGSRYYGAKLMGSNMGGDAPPGIEYVIVLFDRTTNRIAAFVDGNLVTGFRTASTSAAALDRLAPKGHARLAVLGSGLEAAMHTRAFASVRELTEVTVYSPTPERRTAFAEAVTADTGVPAKGVASAKEAVEGADIVLTAARSRGEEPILFAEWLKPGATVVSIGSTIPEQREIDVSVVERSDIIICDTLEEVLEETGDMLAAKAAGIELHNKAFSLADLMSGACADALAKSRAPMFKSVGGGLQDIVVAELILTKAIEAGLATPLPIEFETKS